MTNIKIDYVKTYLPYKKIKGTTEQRLALAKELNFQFFENLEKEFKKDSIHPNTFKRVLKKVAGGKIPVEIVDKKHSKVDAAHNFYVSEKVSCASGYSIKLPLEFFTERIRHTSVKEYLTATQKFFDEICNPKFFKRSLALLDPKSKYDVSTKFFKEVLDTKNQLEPKTLNSFIKQIPQKYRIDTLQTLRYYLQKEKNASDFGKAYMLKINSTPKSEIRYSESAINADPYHYDDKLKLLKDALFDLIQKERIKNRHS